MINSSWQKKKPIATYINETDITIKRKTTERRTPVNKIPYIYLKRIRKDKQGLSLVLQKGKANRVLPPFTSNLVNILL